VKYSPAGATVTLSCAAENGEVVVRVRDQGPGIPLEAQARLFQRFYRVDSSSTRKVGGTGLGLAIAKAIVEQHQGRIWVNSQPGEGSEFAFALPALPAAAPEEQSQPTCRCGCQRKEQQQRQRRNAELRSVSAWQPFSWLMTSRIWSNWFASVWSATVIPSSAPPTAQPV
jgi:hypothetical protein